jgi:hypothetical protein
MIDKGKKQASLKRFNQNITQNTVVILLFDGSKTNHASGFK